MVAGAARRSFLWAGAYVCAMVVGRLTALPDTGLALFWPAAGVAVLWVLRAPPASLRIDLVLLFLSTVVVNVLAGVAPLPATVFGAANVVVGLSGRSVLSGSVGRSSPGGSAGRRTDHASTLGVMALARAAGLAGVLSAPFGLLAGYLITERATAMGALAWSVRNATGVFVVAGVVLAVQAAHRRREPGSPWSCCLTTDARPHAAPEVAASLIAAVAALGLIFWTADDLPLAFLLVAVSAFVGYRYAPVVTAVLTAVAGLIAIVATMTGQGPFGRIDDPVTGALVVQAFVLTQAAIGLTLSSAVAERHALTVELEASRAQADERAQLLDAVTERLAHGVAVIDVDGQVLVKNTAAVLLVPGPEERVTDEDQPARYGVHRADGGPMELSDMPHAVALERGESVVDDLVVRSPGVDETFVRVHAEPLELTGRRPRRVAVVSMQDDTAHRHQVQQLKTFAGVVAHDLRNPLAAMTGWVQMLSQRLEEQHVDDPGSTRALDRILGAGERMSALIEDLLGYATASSAPLRPELIDLAGLVNAVAAEVRAAGTTRPTVVVGDLGPVQADPVLLRQVMSNLIGNAVKYTADDVRPVIHVSSEHGPAGVVIRVTDNGVGIPEEMRAAVFEGFTRVGTTADVRPGIGLGLAICARAVERHHGTITAGPGPGGTGTTITLTVPHPSRAPSAAPAAPARSAPGRAQG